MTFRKKLFVSLVYPTLLICGCNDHGAVPGHVCGPGVCEAIQQSRRNAASITVIMLAVGTQARKLVPFLALGFVVLVIFIWRWKNY